jgi:peroxiredoxin Q/BCP
MAYLIESNLGETTSVMVGSKAPDFTLKTEKNEDWNLSNQTGKVTVLLFYPQNECVICNKQLCSVRDNWEKYTETGATIVGISSGQTSENLEYSLKYKLPITLLADENREITKIFGKHWFLPTSLTRSIVIIDAKGIIRSRKVVFRAFRPSDSEILKDIYTARTEALVAKYKDLGRFSK